LYTFLEKESESKTHAEKNNFKVCMLENQAFKNGDQINYFKGCKWLKLGADYR
jgi:hypothetical protein